MQKAELLLGEWVFSWVPFRKQDAYLAEFSSQKFLSQESKKRFKEVNKALASLIAEESVPCFLLPQVVAFITEINARAILDEPYSLASFEFWLNHFSKLTTAETVGIRSKIAGRYVPREEYQRFFPIGLGKMVPGAHFVAAHLSPDVDTMVSSFWSWLDAFACRVAEGIHYWSLPAGLTDGHIQQFFQKNFGKSVFDVLARANPTLSVTAMDLLSQKDCIKVPLTICSDSINHGEGNIAVIVIDEDGLYRGEWRSQDAEVTSQVVDTLLTLLRWLKNTAIVHLIETLSQDPVSLIDAKASVDELFQRRLVDSEALQEMNDRSKKLLLEYMQCMFRLTKGFEHTFEELLHAVDGMFSHAFAPLFRLQKENAASAQPMLHVDAMKWLEKIVSTFEGCLKKIRTETKTLQHLLEIKRLVLEYPTTFVQLKSDVEEMRVKIGSLDHLTVVIHEGDRGYFPVGIVRARDLQKPILASASLRDFSSLEETKAASYIDVISVIDHHKTNIRTASVPTLLLADAQSTNTLLCECSLEINRSYADATQENAPFWVSKDRELLEYLSQIFAILDDTDLLSKISKRDLAAVVAMVQRMQELLAVGKQTPIALPRSVSSYKELLKVAQQLLQNKELHSIYKKVYHHKETEMSETLKLAAERKPSSFFFDTKAQNGCCRVGQTKLFHSNLALFETFYEKLKLYWIDESIKAHEKEPVIDFFLHMISTVQSEKEIVQGGPQWQHLDELWLWIPQGDVPLQHLSTFLNMFDFSETVQNMSLKAHVEGKRSKEFAALITQNLTKVRDVHMGSEATAHSMIALRFPAGLINSRKSQITPFLPKQVN